MRTPQSYNCMDLNLANSYLNKLGSKFYPKAPRKKSIPANILISALYDPKQKIQMSLPRPLIYKLSDNKFMLL